nr:IS630 family transposase [Brasilonema octagenarum]
MDWDLWQKLYYKHQQEYLRQRLVAIKYLYEGKTRKEVSKLLGCTYKTLTTWIDKFLIGGLVELTQTIRHSVPCRLNYDQQQELKKMLLEQKPIDYGVDRNIWTGKIICHVIKQRWGVELKDSRIYEILDELHMSHQKAHRDYANADPDKQAGFVSTLKKLINREKTEKVVFFDEFAVYARPSIFYAWAQKNTRPQVPSNERSQRQKLNGMICIDAVTGEEYLRLKEHSKTEDVSGYFAEFCLDGVKQGVTKLTVILDNNSTHKQKMRSQLKVHLSELLIQDKIEVEFIDTPPYSPNFNLAEYIIHLLRLMVLHHQPLDITLQKVREKLENLLLLNHVQTPEQIQNTLEHIYSLVR